VKKMNLIGIFAGGSKPLHSGANLSEGHSIVEIDSSELITRLGIILHMIAIYKEERWKERGDVRRDLLNSRGVEFVVVRGYDFQEKRKEV